MTERMQGAESVAPQERMKDVWVTPVLASADLARNTEACTYPADTETSSIYNAS